MSRLGQPTLGRCAVSLGLVALLVPSFASANDSALPVLHLATCAALWDSYSTVLGDEGEATLAARFLSEAVRIGDEAEARALVEERRPWMVEMLHAYIGSGDDQSRELFERLLTDCAALEADLPPAGP